MGTMKCAAQAIMEQIWWKDVTSNITASANAASVMVPPQGLHI